MVNHLSKGAMGQQGYHANSSSKAPSSESLFSEEQSTTFEMIERPVFLVGSERSGITLLRLMLDHHPQITFGAAFEYGVHGVDKAGNCPNNLDNYYQWLQTDKSFLMDGVTIDRRLSYPALVNSFLKQRQSFTNKPIVGAALHRNFDRLLNIWPDAVFIHMVRDGRDVTRSCMKMGWAGDGWHGAKHWLYAERLWDRVKVQLPEHRYLEVRFEELIYDNVGTLDKICQFIDNRVGSSSMIARMSNSGNTSVEDTPTENTPAELRYHPDMMNYAQETGYTLPDASLVNQWHHKLSKREIQLIESRLAPLLVDRGYDLSGLPHLRVSKLGRIGLKIQNKLGILTRKAGKYGLPLASADFVARRLGLSGLSDRIRKKTHVIDMNTMKESW